MTLIRERKRRRKRRETFRTMSWVDRMVCTQDLLRHKEKGEQAETRPGGVLRLGEMLLPERRVKLVASNLSAGDAVADKRMGHRSANGKINASEPGMS